MFGRAYYKTNPFYKDYGARGIKVCKAWFNFITFITDMGSKPTEEHTLDRINVNGNYTPANTRWSSRVEQANNKRRKYRC